MKNFGRHQWKILLAGLVILTIASATNYDRKAFLDHYAPDNSKFGLPQFQEQDTPYDLSIEQVEISEDTSALERSEIPDINLNADHIFGGHRFGMNVPCKSEFPENWDDEKTIQIIKRFAANDNADWRSEGNGYDVSEQMVEGVDIRIVLNRDSNTVVTAYPLNTPRNPCPANDL